jgi:hypothetical protein
VTKFADREPQLTTSPLKVCCSGCGAANFKTPEKPDRASVVTCGGCGATLGTVAEIEAAGKNAQRLMGKEPTRDALREALRKGFAELTTIRVE